jgi:hypothetical protein
LLIELMLRWPAAIDRVVREGGSALFADPQWRDVARDIIEQARDGVDPSMLLERLPAEMRTRVAAALLYEDEDPSGRQQLLEDCMAFLRRRHDRRRVRETREKIRAAEAAGDHDGVRRGLQEWRTLVGATNGADSAAADGRK